MNRQIMKKGTDRVLEFASHVLDGMRLIPPSPDVHARSEGLFQKMEDVDQATESQDSAEADLTVARLEAEKLRRRLLRTSRGGAEFLVAAEPELEAKLPLGDIFANVDPQLLAERVLAVAKHATTDEGKMIARMISRIHHTLAQAEARQTGAEKHKQQVVLDRANKNWALQTAARDAELFIRLVSPKGSPALRHIQSRNSRPGPKLKAQVPAVTEQKPAAAPVAESPAGSPPAHDTLAPPAAHPVPAVAAPAATPRVLEVVAATNEAPAMSNGASGLHALAPETEKAIA